MRKRGFAQGEQHLDCINLVHSLCTLLVRVWSDDNIKYAGSNVHDSCHFSVNWSLSLLFDSDIMSYIFKQSIQMLSTIGEEDSPKVICLSRQTDAAGSLRNVLIIVKDVEDKLRKKGYHCSAMLGKVRQVVRAFKVSKAAVGDAIDAYSERTIESTGEV